MKIHEAFTYLRVKDAPAAIAFYAKAFGATEKLRLTEPSGRVGHAELDFGGTTIMISEEYPEFGIVGPATLGGTSVSVHLHVDDADAAVDRAVAAGATVVRPLRDQFYGERSGAIRDPFGHDWLIGRPLAAPRTGKYDDRMQKARITVTVGRATLAKVERQVKRGRAPSVSAWVDAAMEEKARREELVALLAEMRAEGRDATEAEETWARGVLGL